MKKSKKQNILLIIAIVIMVAAVGVLGFGYFKAVTQNIPNPIATIEIEGMGTIKVELYPHQAPNTVANFIKLANEGYYNGLTFHRTIPDFMIQGGDKEGDGSGKTDYTIPGEFIANGFNDNTLQHKRGVISMARSDYTQASSELTAESYNSGGAQFFIMTADNTSLDGLYAGFGEVIEGMDIVDKIANVEVVTRDETATEGVDKPVNPPVMTSVTVETFGVNYGEPTTLTPFDYNTWLMERYGGSMY